MFRDGRAPSQVFRSSGARDLASAFSATFAPRRLSLSDGLLCIRPNVTAYSASVGAMRSGPDVRSAVSSIGRSSALASISHGVSYAAAFTVSRTSTVSRGPPRVPKAPPGGLAHLLRAQSHFGLLYGRSEVVFVSNFCRSLVCSLGRRSSYRRLSSACEFGARDSALACPFKKP